MLRSTSIAILLVAGSALGALLLCMLTLRLVISALFALSGIRRRVARSAEILDW